MNTKILDQLEFNKVKDQFTEYLQTEQAQAELRDLVPMTNSERIQNQFTEIQEMAEIFVEHHALPLVAYEIFLNPCVAWNWMLISISRSSLPSRRCCKLQLTLVASTLTLKMLSLSLLNVFSKNWGLPKFTRQSSKHQWRWFHWAFC